MSESNKVSVTVIKDFRDKNRNNQWMSKGHVTQMSETRAQELAEKGLIVIGEEGTEKVNQRHTEKDKNAGPNRRKRSAE